MALTILFNTTKFTIVSAILYVYVEIICLRVYCIKGENLKSFLYSYNVEFHRFQLISGFDLITLLIRNNIFNSNITILVHSTMQLNWPGLFSVQDDFMWFNWNSHSNTCDTSTQIMPIPYITCMTPPPRDFKYHLCNTSPLQSKCFKESQTWVLWINSFQNIAKVTMKACLLDDSVHIFLNEVPSYF